MPGIRQWGLVASCLLSSACVGETQYEEAHSAAEVQSEAYRRAEFQIAKLEQELARVKAELQVREDSISKKEERLAQADFDLEVATQKDAAKGYMVDRLRDELARAGDHLKAFADEKERLHEELTEIQSHATAIERAERRVARVAGVVRDMSLLESGALGSGELELSVEAGQPVLRTASETLFASAGASLSDRGRRLAASLGKLGSLHEDVAFGLGDTGAGSKNVASLQALGQAIVATGVKNERVVLEAVKANEEDGATPQVQIRLQLPEAESDASEAEADLGGPASG